MNKILIADEEVQGVEAGSPPPQTSSPLSEDELSRVDELRSTINQYYKDIPMVLRHAPSSQERCLDYLLDAERNLNPPITRTGIIRSRLDLTRVQIEIGRVRSSRFSFTVVVAVVYMFAVAISAAFSSGILESGADARELNERLIMGIPLPIIAWSVIGSFTSMLLRAGQLPFSNPQEALRWLLFRPIVGVVMGLLTYLMVTAGLIVFAGTGKAQTPELLWVIAFIGSFSDTLSINLLQRVIGRFQTPEESPERSAGKVEANGVKGQQ